uniref:Ribonuclease VapC n=1 Tax=Candidatus Kentrum sp. FM TaxID=2126340 RepID=A0A450VTX8_9GAMM|nr:MAG: hypothetical protein BECKFM1743C_GA0114222_100414 [Candidatus Kentron sp. FM]VFJ48937.1 MAG: hypothetical protein BECKFM1743A_GA0114220_1006414 [Candidatus Kentron sp. FM]VFK08235.1 MAG: hypothetical protein BECKFM1743B_GA0114221_1006313 [Candidatus Kentron sp. FM]
MLFDTDVLIWVQRGNPRAAEIIRDDGEPAISIYTYMELQQSAKNNGQLRIIRSFIKDMRFRVLPLTPEIGHRASAYVEEYTLAHAVRAGDALIAATAMENAMTLCTGNVKHFSPIRELAIEPFRTE